jgi:uncharacterized repeat protein (TIGR02543 family)
VAPVGDTWLRAIRTNLAMRNPYAPTAGLINLWDTDYFHSSKWGAYLSACVLFYQITGADPRQFGAAEQAAAGLGIPGGDAIILQQLAYDQVQAAPNLAPANNPQPAVTSFTLVNATTDQDIQALTNGATLNLATLPSRSLNVRANTNPGTVGSVVFSLSGAINQSQTESIAPYALYSDSGGDYNPWTPVVGSYSLLARPYSGGSGTGTAGTALSVQFSVIDQSTATQYTLSTATTGSGAVSKSPDQPTYNSGSIVVLTATPAAGYAFSGWSGSATGSTNPLNVAMSASKTISATFVAIPQYSLTVTTAGNGTVSKSPDQPTYNSGSSVVLTATPAAGYRFSAWSGSATGSTNPLTVTMSASKTITATFVPTNQYTLAITTVGNGTVTKSPDQLSYTNNTSVSMTAVPAAGYRFSAWSGSSTGSTNPRSITMNGNKAVTATFVQLTQYTLTVNTPVNGTVTKSPNQPTYDTGSIVVLTATPAAGYAFSGWSGSATGSTNPLNVAMSANKTISATFTAVPQYSLTVTTAGNGTVSKTPDQPTYNSGSSVVLTAAPAAGSTFSGWGGSAAGSANPLTVTMSTSKTITATFAAVQVQYLLTVNSTGNGTVTKTPDQPAYDNGSVVTLTAIPAAGYRFSGWNGAATGTTNPLNVTMSADQTIAATFVAVPQYILTVSPPVNGTVSKSPDQPVYDSGSSVVLTATPAAGYTFSGWSGSATGASNPLTVTMSADQTIEANFVAAPPQYTLTTTSSGNGTVSKSPDQPSYTSGSVVGLTATPAAGYTFSGWSGSATGSGNPLSVTMDGSKTIAATFAALPPVQYQLAVTTTGSGTVSKSPDQPAYDSGSSVVLTATPAAGYTFSGWSGSAAGSANPLSVNMSADKTITATFTAIPQYLLTVTTSGSGTVSKSPDQPGYDSGSSVVLTATPAAGYTFSGWSGSATGSANPLTVTMSTSKTITATFAAVPPQYTLAVNTTGNGTVAKNPNQATYTSGSVVTLTASPAAGNSFSGWSGSATGSSNPLSVTMSANKTITATFAALPAGQSVSSFTLMNADTDQDIQPLTSGATLNLATLPSRNLSVRANTNPAPVGSVVFRLDGPVAWDQTETTPPYALFSDGGGDYYSTTLRTGFYALRATPYTGGGGSGTAGTVLSINFTIIDQAARTVAAVMATTHATEVLPVPARTLPGQAYPNPSPTGRFTIQLPMEVRGEVAYTLESAIGVKLAAGTLQVGQPTSVLALDFSRQMTVEGLYYLRLAGYGLEKPLRLMRSKD